MDVRSTEDKIVQRIANGHRKRLKTLALSIGDDAALLRPRPHSETILTCDWFLEGTHFLTDLHPPDSVGWKCLARAVSDVAAMGGLPKYFLLSLTVPNPSASPKTANWLAGFLRGLRRAERKFGCDLVGGDTTQREEILINITVVGEAPAGRAVRRSGGKAGDRIFVSGRLGEAEMGLRLLRTGARTTPAEGSAVRKHLYPEPRLGLGQWLAKQRLASSMMDLSDGLSSDLPRLCAASQVGARLEAVKIPSPKVPQAKRGKHQDPLVLALNGGDDYELLFTVRPENLRRIPDSFQNIALTEIGEITRARKITLVQSDGTARRLPPGGWDPFRH